MSYFNVVLECDEEVHVVVEATYRISPSGQSISFDSFVTSPEDRGRLGDDDGIIARLDEIAWDRLPDYRDELRLEHARQRS